jgi:hypothetical protein
MNYKKTPEYKQAIKSRLCGVTETDKEVNEEDVLNNPTSMAEMYSVGKEKYRKARSFGFSHLQSLLMATKL